VGYSFGGTVAFEMALQLEKRNELVSMLLLLDGSPKWKDTIANFDEGDAFRNAFESSVLFNLLQQYKPDIDLTVFKQLSEIESLEDKWKFMTKFLSSAFPEFGTEELTDFMMSYMKRMGCATVYEASGKVKAKTVLVKALQMRLNKAMAADYGLSEICEQEVKVIGVEGNHYCFYEKPIELDLPGIVNNILRN
jgi:fatty acid synthase